MEKYLTADFKGGSFILFSAPHLIALAVIMIIIIFIYLFRRKLKASNKYIRIIISTFIVLQQLSLTLWYIYYGNIPLKASLPLELCDVSMIISAVMFAGKNYFLYEIVYFWGLAGSAEALLTPDIGIYTFPHYVFFQFFLSHGSIVILILFMTFVYEFRPTVKSLIKSLMALNIYAAYIGIYDKLMGTNFMYLCGKTEAHSLMDYLGPWPWYLISLELAAVISFALCLLPFIIGNRSGNLNVPY